MLPAWLRRWASPPRTPAPHEYRPSGTLDDIVRVFFLTHAGSPQRLKQTIDEIRSISFVPRMLPYSPVQAIIVGGTAAQMHWPTG